MSLNLQAVATLTFSRARALPAALEITVRARNAAAGGHLEVLECAWSVGCPSNMYTYPKAAAGGHLDASDVDLI